jgi:hypothetical protein
MPRKKNIKKIYLPPAVYELEKKDKIINKGVVCDGLADFDKSRILLSKTLKDHAYYVTLMHEIFHCILADSGFTNIIKNEDKEEYIVQLLANNTINFIQENQEIVKQIMELKDKTVKEKVHK